MTTALAWLTADARVPGFARLSSGNQLPVPRKQRDTSIKFCKVAGMDQTSTIEGDNTTQERILAATAEVLGRNGKRKLSLSDVAVQAGVSRPTLYRWFASKEDLLSAFSTYERVTFESGMSQATAGLKGADKLDAALRFIVAYQHSYTGVRMVDIEPEHVISQFAGVIPQMRDRLQRLIPGPNAAVKAATAIRVAFSHYVIRSDDADEFLAQLRHAVGLKPS